MSCNSRVSKPNTLFDIGDSKLFSHVFTVAPGEVYVVTAQGLMDDDVLAVETVTGCGAGDIFECYRSPSCDCGVELSCDNTRVVIPFTGRYRLSVVTGSPGDYRVTAFPTANVGFTEGNMSCGCSSGGSAAKAVDAILSSPSALAGLCTGLGPCISAAVATAVTPTPSNPTPSPIVLGVVETIVNSPVLLQQISEAIAEDPDAAAAIAAVASNNPSAFVLLEDAFGVDLGYMFPL